MNCNPLNTLPAANTDKRARAVGHLFVCVLEVCTSSSITLNIQKTHTTDFSMPHTHWYRSIVLLKMDDIDVKIIPQNKAKDTTLLLLLVLLLLLLLLLLWPSSLSSNLNNNEGSLVFGCTRENKAQACHSVTALTRLSLTRSHLFASFLYQQLLAI